MTTKNSLIIAAAIIIGFSILGLCQRYDFIAPSGNAQIFVVDKATGKVWSKFQSTTAGPTNWECIKP